MVHAHSADSQRSICWSGLKSHLWLFAQADADGFSDQDLAVLLTWFLFLLLKITPGSAGVSYSFKPFDFIHLQELNLFVDSLWSFERFWLLCWQCFYCSWTGSFVCSSCSCRKSIALEKLKPLCSTGKYNWIVEHLIGKGCYTTQTGLYDIWGGSDLQKWVKPFIVSSPCTSGAGCSAEVSAVPLRWWNWSKLRIQQLWEHWLSEPVKTLRNSWAVVPL